MPWGLKISTDESGVQLVFLEGPRAWWFFKIWGVQGWPRVLWGLLTLLVTRMGGADP